VLYDQYVVLDVLNLLVIVYNVVANRGGCMLDNQNVDDLQIGMPDTQNFAAILELGIPNSLNVDLPGVGMLDDQPLNV